MQYNEHNLSMIKDMGLNQSVVMPPEATESYAHRYLSMRAQSMLNTSFGESLLKKEASRRKIEALRRFQGKDLLHGKSQVTGGDDPAYASISSTESPLKMRVGGPEIISLSVFSRPVRPTVAETHFCNPEAPDDGAEHYQHFSLTTS